MPPKLTDEVYSDESTVPNIGKGLFAKTKIRKKSIIAEFKGKLKKPGEETNGPRSNIYFEDEYVMECPDGDLASFANDAINFTRTQRRLMEALASDAPLYKKHPGAKINASIKINNNLHRAFLIANDDIEPGEEIFCHYGFDYWFGQEISEVGFLQEDEINRNGFPEKIFEHPAFIHYIREFCSGATKIEIKPYKNFLTW